MKTKERLSKLMALCLAFMLMVGLFTTTAYAEITSNISITKDATGIITVNDVEDNLTINAYRLMDVNVSENGQPQEPVYTWVTEVAGWVREKYPDYIGKDTDNSVQATFNNSVEKGDIATFYDELAAAIRKNSIKLEATGTATSLNQAATISNMPMGNYLILIENGMRVYCPSAVNLVPVWKDNEWVMSDARVTVKFSDPTITKTVTDATKKMDNFNIGDTVNFTIVAAVPQFPTNALAKGYAISDKLPEGMTLTDDPVKVYGVVDNAEDALLNAGENNAYILSNLRPVGGVDSVDTTFTLTFNYDKIQTYSQIKVTYSAVLDGDAVLGEAGNLNTAILDYNNNPYNANGWKTQFAEATVYTYGLNISKVKKGDTKTLLAGAEFELYLSEKDANEGTKINFVQESDGVYRRALTTGEQGSVTTTLKVGSEGAKTGKLTIKGLDEGTWYLKETKAPGGYNKLKSPVEVTITDTEDGKIVNDDDESGLLPLTVENDNGFTLPTTGGMGTILFTAVGVTLMGAGIVILLVIRKKKNGAEQ